MDNRIIKKIGTWLGLLLLAGCLWVLHQELKTYHLADIASNLRSIPRIKLFQAAIITLLDFAVLIFCEILSFRYVQKKLSGAKIALTSFVAYSFSNSAGFSGFSGASVRYRFYSAFGLSGFGIAKLIAFVNSSFAFGFLLLAGLVFTWKPFPIPAQLHLPFVSSQPLGLFFLFIVIFYFAWIYSRKTPLKFKEWEFELPRFNLTCVQIFLAAFDFLLLGAVFYVLLPASANLPFETFTAVYLLAMAAGIISQVPGGLGVFETVMVMTLPNISKPVLLGSLLAYRTIYYLLPLGIGAFLLGVHELRHRREQLKEMSDYFTNASVHFLPFFISLAVFLSGTILLLSGSTPHVVERIVWLRELIPLPVMEISHFLGSIVGAGLLVLAWGIQKRLNAAYPLTILLLSGGILLSLIKGFDYEEALVLSLMLGMTLPCKRHFYRKTSLMNEPFSGSWILAITLALFASVWLGLFAYKHVGYSHDLWWRFAFHEDAPRFMRASVGAITVLFIFALMRLLMPAKLKPTRPSPEEIDIATAIVKKSPHTSSQLALLGDKLFRFNEKRNAFIMYAIQGTSWVTFGDPVGPAEETQELIWDYHEQVDINGGSTVFYDVSKENLFRYLDLGLVPIKMGEEARIPLENFSLEGGRFKNLRSTVSSFQKHNCTFEIIPETKVPALLPELKKISDRWLADKNTKEKGFSLGFFDENYLRNFPVSIIRRDEKIIAFTNLWLSAEKEELSVDLMRYDTAAAPNGVMDYLFIQLMLWGQAQGYRWFNLGMAPLSGLEDRTLAPLWNKLGAFLFRHGEHFYNFQGLRQYKEKFHPVWEPKYLISPGGFALPRILTDIATLISGDLKGLVRK